MGIFEGIFVRILTRKYVLTRHYQSLNINSVHGKDYREEIS